MRWPGKVSNELVRTVDWFTTLLHVAGATVPDDRIIDGMDMRDFLLGDAEEIRLRHGAVPAGQPSAGGLWRRWKVLLFAQDGSYSTWTPLNLPHLYNLEWDPREEQQVNFPHGRSPTRRPPPGPS